MESNSKYRTEISRVLTGEASAEEMKQFFDSLEENDQKKQVFEAFRMDWEASKDAMIYRSLDIEENWDKQRNFIAGQRTDKKKNWQWIGWAAALLIGVSAALIFFNTSEKEMLFTQVVLMGKPNEKFQLPDGTNIFVNGPADIQYAFSAKARNIKLEGEAYFEVSKDADRPFVIDMNNSYVKVLGTSFLVNTNNDLVQVNVKEGLVEFGQTASEDKVLLEAGAMGVLSNSVLQKSQLNNDNYLSWHTRKLVFEAAQLPLVFADLEQTYQVKFSFDQSRFEQCRLTANFDNEKLQDVLSTIEVIFNINFSQTEEGKFIVTGSGCE